MSFTPRARPAAVTLVALAAILALAGCDAGSESRARDGGFITGDSATPPPPGLDGSRPPPPPPEGCDTWTDADGDGIGDQAEGMGDTDADGTADYLDSDTDG